MKIRDNVSSDYLLRMVRIIALALFALGTMFGMSLGLLKIVTVEEMQIEAYQLVLIPFGLLSVFIFFFLYLAVLLVPELKRRLAETR